jgi:hypothetical protein
MNDTPECIQEYPAPYVVPMVEDNPPTLPSMMSLYIKKFTGMHIETISDGVIVDEEIITELDSYVS